MFCPNCGKQIPDESVFCPDCGTRVKELKAEPERRETPKEPQKEEAAPKVRKEEARHASSAATGTAEKKVPAPKQKAMLIKAGVIAAAAVAVIAGFAVLKKPSIRLNKYMTIRVEGYDTVGRAGISFDTDAFYEDYGKKILAQMKKKDKSLQMSADSAASSLISDCVKGELDQSSQLSNGDTVTFKWDCDDEYALEEYGFKLKYSDIEEKVEDLEAVTTFDAFSGVELGFEGVAPDGKAYVDTASQNGNGLEYELSPQSGLNNGDTVVLSVLSGGENDAAIEYYIEEHGSMPQAFKKEYTVSGLGKYVSACSEITAEGLSGMQSQAEDVFHADVAEDWDPETETLKGFEYLGSYLLTKKQRDLNGAENILYLAYRATANNRFTNSRGESYHQDNSFYWYIRFENMQIDGDGSFIVDLTDYDTPHDRFKVDSGVSSGFWGTQSWSYDGYRSLEDLYRNAVTTKLADYKAEENLLENAAAEAPKATEAASAEAAEAQETAAEAVQETTAKASPETTAQAAETKAAAAAGAPETSAAALAESTQEAGTTGFIFPDSSERLLSEAEIGALSQEELRYAINELYAKHGYIFKDQALADYFGRYAWYQPSIAADSFNENVFNQTEKDNIKLMQKYRK